MSILIKGMEMPKKCKQCWFFGTDSAIGGYCYLLKGELPLPDGVPQDCPIIEVPTPHGRLIDADAMEKECCHGCKNEFHKYENCIDCVLANAPTIIPADPKEEGE